MTKYLNISTDTSLGGLSPSDEVVSSQKAMKTYIDAQSGATDMTGATASTAGTHGLVPAPAAGDQDKVLHGDGTWKVGVGIHPDLFDHKWSDYELSDMNWVCADNFSWLPKSGTNGYPVAYDHLADDISGKSLSSETVAGVTIQFYLADDGHKICPDSQESNVASIYSATGVAWYYIIDTVNQRFKLPRTKFAETGLRDTVGNYVAPGLPAPTSTFSMWVGGGGTYNGFVGNTYSAAGTRNVTANTDNIYGQSTTVQPPATQMCLYFYVGNFTQTALENTAGLNAEMFNELNAHKVIDFQAPTAQNNYTWYRKYADGWVEQGGRTSISSSGTTVNLPITMADTHYNINYSVIVPDSFAGALQVYINGTRTVSSFVIKSPNNTPQGDWQVCGMAA